jgi:hypothetical protein
MSDPEIVVAAYNLLQLKEDTPHRCLNLANAPVTVDVPRIGLHCIRRDLRRTTHIIDHGTMPEINWSDVKREFETSTSQVLHRAVSIQFIDVNNGSNSFDSPLIDLDTLMSNQDIAGCVIHGRHVVYIATFTQDICTEISQIAQTTTGLSYQYSESVIRGIKKIGNNDVMQSKEVSVYTAGFEQCHYLPTEGNG